MQPVNDRPYLLRLKVELPLRSRSWPESDVRSLSLSSFRNGLTVPQEVGAPATGVLTLVSPVALASSAQGATGTVT